MPPKVARRPAARLAAVAKARLAPLRRPAAVEKDPQQRFLDSEEVKSGDVIPSHLLSCGRVWCTGVSYWKEQTQCVGEFKSLRIEEGETWLDLTVSGTKSEHLLKHLTGVPGRKVRAHLCGSSCSQELTANDLIHVLKLKKLTAEEEEEWMKNLLVAGREPADELEVLRREARRAGGESPVESDGGDRLRRKKKKDKKEKAKAKERDREEKKEVSPSPGARRRHRSRDLGIILGGSGLDPDPLKRKKYLRKAEKLIKKRRKKKKTSSGSSSTSKKRSCSSSEASSFRGASDIFGQTKMAKKIAERCPGVLTASSLATVQEQLLTTQGQVWELDRRELPPLFLQYFRAHLGPRMSPAMRREALHLSFCLDLGLQGRIPELMDVLGQRLKALEGQTAGRHWSVTSQFEVVPEEQGSVATALETEAAMREAREAGRLRAQSGRAYGSTGGPDRTEEWRREAGKGKTSKGQGKGKDWRRDSKGDNKDSRKEAEKDKERAKGK